MKCFSYCDHKISLQNTTLHLINTRAKPECPTYWFSKIWIFPTDTSNTQAINISLKCRSNYKMSLNWFNIISVKWIPTNLMMIIVLKVRPHDRKPDESTIRNTDYKALIELKVFFHCLLTISLGTCKSSAAQCVFCRPMKHWHLESTLRHFQRNLTSLHHLSAWFFFPGN